LGQPSGRRASSSLETEGPAPSAPSKYFEVLLHLACASTLLLFSLLFSSPFRPFRCPSFSPQSEGESHESNLQRPVGLERGACSSKLINLEDDIAVSFLNPFDKFAEVKNTSGKLVKGIQEGNGDI